MTVEGGLACIGYDDDEERCQNGACASTADCPDGFACAVTCCAEVGFPSATICLRVCGAASVVGAVGVGVASAGATVNPVTGI